MRVGFLLAGCSVEEIGLIGKNENSGKKGCGVVEIRAGGKGLIELGLVRPRDGCGVEMAKVLYATVEMVARGGWWQWVGI